MCSPTTSATCCSVPPSAQPRTSSTSRIPGRVKVVGDVMVDVALRLQPAARADSQTLSAHGLMPGAYLLFTAHRAGNVDDPERLSALVDLLLELPDPVIFPLHPRTRSRLADADLLEVLAAQGNLTLTEPLGYLELSALLCQARAVLTDSGGLQKEAYLASVPCLTLQSEHRVGGDGRHRLEHPRRSRSPGRPRSA